MKEIKDSGSRREFKNTDGTVGVRDMAEGKGRFDLIPWDVIWDLAKHFEAGAKKYSEGNWKSLPTWTFKDSGMRHLAKHLMGHDDEDHLISAIWNLVCLYHLEHKEEPKMIPVIKADPKDFHVADISEVQFHTCDECGRETPTLFKKGNDKNVCYRCWHKSEDDLK